MAEITASLVKALREATGLSMMDCKKALVEADGDMSKAQDILRKKVGSTVTKKSGRATGEGTVAICVAPDGKSAAMVEVRCETDFCAKNDQFQAMAADLARQAAAGADGKVEATPAMTAAIGTCLAKIGENMGFARGVKISAPRVGTYRHHNNKVGVVIGIEGEVTDQLLTELCQHIAFHDPIAVSVEDMPADFVANEKRLAVEQAVESGKPKDIAEKMVVGKLRKVLGKNAMLEQPFVRDETKTVKEVLGGAKVVAFARFAVGSSAA
jgi:elongation factor Ts